MKTYKFSKGSEWRKWDLHIHSNASSDGKATPEEIIEEAKRKDISVIAITDHHTVKNVDILKELGEKDGIKVIAGIEFRTEYGKKSVHMIGLFPDYDNNKQQLTKKALNELILCPLELSETKIINKGKQNNCDKNITDEKAFKEGMHLVQVDFKKAAELIHNHGGLVSVHAGSKENSIEGMKHESDSPQQNVHELYNSLGVLKDELLNNHVDICEISKESDSRDFYINNYELPCIIASDAHTKDKIGEKFTWIKADLTFDGLKQILCEPKDRVKIPSSILEELNEDKKIYNLIEKVKFIDNSEGKKFTNREIGFSPDLNAIIGGKSSGKSLLMHAIAKKIDKINYDKKYDDILSSVDLEIYYADNPNTKKTQDDKRVIEFLPQLYIERIIRDKLVNKFIKDLIQQDEKINKLYENHKNTLEEAKNKLKSSIELWIELDKQLCVLKDKLKPLGDKRVISVEASNLEKKIDELMKNKELSKEKLEKYHKLKESNKKNQERINKLIRYKEEMINMQNYIGNEILFSNVLGTLTFESRDKFISNLFAELKERIQQSLKLNIDNFKEKLEKKLEKIKKIKNELSKQIEENNKELKPFLEKNEKESEIKILKKNIETENIKLKKIKSIETEIEESQKKRDANEFIKYYKQITGSYKTIVNSINTAIQKKWKDEQIQITLTASSIFDSKKFTENISSVINIQSSLEKQFIECNFNDSNYEFSEETHFNNIEKMLKIIIGDENRFNNFKKNGNTESLLDFLLEDCNDIDFDIKRENDSLHNMSEGKKGIVILQLYLSLSKSDCPILIDQPEDNLDNRTIYVELNDYIRHCKQRRQIIMISHNANLVVNTDAENVIVANQSGENDNENKEFRFEYVNGSLENTFDDKSNEKGILYKKGIREHVCEILEGGVDAFKKREKKYRV
ncbi:MAG: PHP domain-containing protein [Endomicrobium sp.]|jgi:hypothetical protein|nr:PHP domain-containing protein [Endomicrobium sp.]